MLASQLRTEPAPPALEGDPKLWTAREVPKLLIADLRSLLSSSMCHFRGFPID